MMSSTVKQYFYSMPYWYGTGVPAYWTGSSLKCFTAQATKSKVENWRSYELCLGIHWTVRSDNNSDREWDQWDEKAGRRQKRQSMRLTMARYCACYWLIQPNSVYCTSASAFHFALAELFNRSRARAHTVGSSIVRPCGANRNYALSEQNS